MFLRQLEYLSALARERHFGRAAQACHISQPALSAALLRFERELGVTLVYRGSRYDDLTEEGRQILAWAHQTLASVDGLNSEAARLRQQLTGSLRLGVIPTALPAVSLITGPLLANHPAVRVVVRSVSSIEIGRQLASHDIDAGVTYLDNEPLGAVVTTPAYRERYVFLTATDTPGGQRGTITWAKAAARPLCLLTPDMQNRRIIDAAFRSAGTQPVPRVEANSISALLSHVLTGWSSVIAHTWLALHGLPQGMRALRLTNPSITHMIGLVTPDTQLQHPLVRALRDQLAAADIDTELERRQRTVPGKPL